MKDEAEKVDDERRGKGREGKESKKRWERGEQLRREGKMKESRSKQLLKEPPPSPPPEEKKTRIKVKNW